MPSLPGHAFAGLAITALFHRDRLPRRTWALAAACAVAPDLDWFVSLGGLHRGHFLNHRGVSHSLFVALGLATLAFLAGYRKELRRFAVWLCLAVAALSHGLLDACTSGGVGVALFMPFSDTRWACVWQPGSVAPLPFWREMVPGFLGSLAWECVWIGAPALGVLAVARLGRQVRMVPALSEAAPEFEG